MVHVLLKENGNFTIIPFSKLYDFTPTFQNSGKHLSLFCEVLSLVLIFRKKKDKFVYVILPLIQDQSFDTFSSNQTRYNFNFVKFGQHYLYENPYKHNLLSHKSNH